ncbi:MAG: DUF1802 family protein [Miltoncostaeaceae bacterium]
MPEHALKEWAVTIEALRRGHQVLIVRKGGIGEKRFALPHPRFYLFPGYLHQRPELVAERWRGVFAEVLDRREDPDLLPLPAYASIHAAHPIADPDALAALGPEHILADDYAAERLRWRRKHPLWAVVLRVWRVDTPPVLEVGAEHGGCVSWVDLPEYIGAPAGLTPALDDDAFAAAAGRVESILTLGAAH